MKKLFITIFLLFFVASSVWSVSDERSVIVKDKNKTDSDTSETSYYALIIGNNNYRYLPHLKTANNDAVEVDTLLKNKFGFQTKLLLDATRDNILDAINDLRKRLGEKDNLIIYYAGHGEYDKQVEKAFWLPVDADSDNTKNWIIADDITSNIKRIASRHILIVSDSCYSGTLTRSAITYLKDTGGRNKYLQKIDKRVSRNLMASGGNEPVADSGGGKNSVFAAAFLTALKEEDREIFSAEEIFHGRVKSIVAGKSEQIPEYAEIRNSGHEGGDFIFLARGSVIIEKPVEQETVPANDTGVITITSNVSNAKVYLNGEYEGQAPVTKTLETGNYEIEVRKEGYITWSETVRIERGKEKSISIILDQTKKAEEYGSTYTDSVTGMEFIFVKGGCYQMGDTFGDGEADEMPVHEVCVDDFYIGKYEVSQGQWKEIMGNNPSYFKDCGDNCPVEQVSWNDIQEYIKKLNQKTGKNYRLPTEAEWEYAARSGGKKEKWAGTNSESELSEYAWFGSFFIEKGDNTHLVGRKRPNGLGLYDMSGNVWEWVQDWYHEKYYKHSLKDNPKGPTDDWTRLRYRVLRGGSWSYYPRYTRTANRSRSSPALRNYYNGFRLLRTK